MAHATTLAFRTSRPIPPPQVDEVAHDCFLPAPDVLAWIRTTFLTDGSALYNPDHLHLAEADIGVLWTNTVNRRQMRYVVATAEDPNPTGGGVWKNGRAKQQLTEWFGDVPDFLITLYAPGLALIDDRSFCAIIEHELYHCGHATNEFDSPKYHNDGSPVFGIRGHDVEEFMGVAARYGLTQDLQQLIAHAAQQPKIPDRLIAGVCGTCLKRAA